MKWLLAVTIILVAVTRIVQSAPMMEGCKRWRGCSGVDPKGPKTPEISIDDIPKDMARYCKFLFCKFSVVSFLSVCSKEEISENFGLTSKSKYWWKQYFLFYLLS